MLKGKCCFDSSRINNSTETEKKSTLTKLNKHVENDRKTLKNKVILFGLQNNTIDNTKA